MEHVTRLLPIDEPGLPEVILLLQSQEPQLNALISRLAPLHRIFQTVCAPEVRAVFTALFNKIQKQ